jgi:hypothetical protein
MSADELRNSAGACRGKDRIASEADDFGAISSDA